MFSHLIFRCTEHLLIHIVTYVHFSLYFFSSPLNIYLEIFSVFTFPNEFSSRAYNFIFHISFREIKKIKVKKRRRRKINRYCCHFSFIIKTKAQKRIEKLKSNQIFIRVVLIIDVFFFPFSTSFISCICVYLCFFFWQKQFMKRIFFFLLLLCVSYFEWFAVNNDIYSWIHWY